MRYFTNSYAKPVVLCLLDQLLGPLFAAKDQAIFFSFFPEQTQPILDCFFFEGEAPFLGHNVGDLARMVLTQERARTLSRKAAMDHAHESQLDAGGMIYIILLSDNLHW